MQEKKTSRLFRELNFKKIQLCINSFIPGQRRKEMWESWLCIDRDIIYREGIHFYYLYLF